MPDIIELGLDTFGDVTFDSDGQAPCAGAGPPPRRRRGRAGRSGSDFDFFGVGEHHRKDFAVSAPEVVLAAIAGQTSRIRLGSAVTVLSSDDPIRVLPAVLHSDALSNGRAEVILGRGSFTESFPLFGYDLLATTVLFEEKLDLFAEILDEQPVTWTGTTRRAAGGAVDLPADRERAPARLGRRRRQPRVGRARGAPRPAADAGDHRRQPAAVRCRTSSCIGAPSEQFGHAARSRSARIRPGHVAATDEQAREELWPHYAAMMTRIGAERGWPPVARAQFEREAGPDGALCVGSPETVARRSPATVKALACRDST